MEAMVRAVQRQRELLVWLESERSLSLHEIIRRFSISRMTAHRDLQLLEKRQMIKRIHGGVVALERSQTDIPVEPAPMPQHFDCVICRRPASQNLLYSITLDNGEQRQACCPHCGISAHLVLGGRIAMAMTADYLFGHPHPVPSSYFVLGSAAVPCCTPSMLTFEHQETARRFQKGFGGLMGRLNDAIDYLQQEMSMAHNDATCPNCTGVRKLDLNFKSK